MYMQSSDIPFQSVYFSLLEAVKIKIVKCLKLKCQYDFTLLTGMFLHCNSSSIIRRLIYSNKRKLWNFQSLIQSSYILVLKCMLLL